MVNVMPFLTIGYSPTVSYVNVFLDLFLCELFEFLNRVRHLLGSDVRFFLRVDAKRRHRNQRGCLS
jgi:hypothetical protein